MIRLFIALMITFIVSPVFAQNAADAFYDSAEMAKARAALKSSHGGQINSLILGERLEYHSNDGSPLSVWEAQGWFGGDIQKLWFKTEGEYEFRLTQRLMLQPRVELNGAFSDDEAIGVGSGLSTAEAGLRHRYEISREFAPYVGVSWNRAFGKTQDFVRAEGEDSDQVSWVAGVRFWF